MQYGKQLRVIAVASSLIVLVAVVAGLAVVGSPAKERARKRDQQRISNLQELENNIIMYWQAKKALPVALNDLNDATRGITIPLDPQTRQPYSYTIGEALTFTLCATFEHDGKGVPNYRSSDDIWDYTAGQTCFERTIDPDFYKDTNTLDTPFMVPPTKETTPIR